MGISGDRFQYFIKNESHTYTVDFKVFTTPKEFYYIETKGWKKEVDDIKWKAVIDSGNRLDVFFKKDLLMLCEKYGITNKNITRN